MCEMLVMNRTTSEPRRAVVQPNPSSIYSSSPAQLKRTPRILPPIRSFASPYPSSSPREPYGPQAPAPKPVNAIVSVAYPTHPIDPATDSPFLEKFRSVEPE